MALISPTKKSDQEFLIVWADIIEITYRLYKKKPTQETKEHLEGFVKAYEDLKQRIETNDYTKEDARYWQMEAFFNQMPLSPYAPNWLAFTGETRYISK